MTEDELEMMKSLGIIPPDDDVDTQIEQVKNDKAFISNELVDAIYTASNTLTAFKILFYIARIDTDNCIKCGEILKINVNLNDFEKYTQLNKRTLDYNIEDIQKTIVTYYDVTKKEKRKRIPLIGKVDYIDGKNVIIDMYEEIHDRINETGDDFTIINTLNIMKIEHKHSPKMIMLLTKIAGYDEKLRQKTYNLKQLNYMFDVHYESFYMFEKKILKPIKTELDNNSSVSFNYIKVIDRMSAGKGRKPIKEIKITPVIKKYVETDIFSNFENKQTIQSKPQKPKQDLLTKIQEQYKLTDLEITTKKLSYKEYLSKNPNTSFTFEDYLLNSIKKNPSKTKTKTKKEDSFNFNTAKAISDKIKDWLEFDAKIDWLELYYWKDIKEFEVKTKQGMLKIGWQKVYDKFKNKEETLLYRIEQKEEIEDIEIIEKKRV